MLPHSGIMETVMETVMEYFDAETRNGTKKFDIKSGKSIVAEKMCRNMNDNEPEHAHEFIEIIYTINGKFTHYINGKPYSVSRGDMLFINYGETHSFTVDSECATLYNFSFKPEFLSENIIDKDNINDIFLLFLPEGASVVQPRRTSCVRFVGKERVEIERLSANMCEEQSHSSDSLPCHGYMLNAYMRLILAKLIRALMLDAGENMPRILTDEVLKYIDDNFTSPLDMASLANHCFYNPAYLGRVFKTVYGKSMKEYIREKRMNLAMELLTTTSLSVEEICSRVGYTGKDRFYRYFKEFFGKTPGDFRKIK